MSTFSYYRNGVNEDVYQAKGDIPLWVIANYFRVHENTLRNWMKKELSKEKKQEILAVIEKIKKGNAEG